MFGARLAGPELAKVTEGDRLGSGWTMYAGHFSSLLWSIRVDSW